MQAVQELKDERTHTELIIQHKENVQAKLEALKHEVSRVDKELAELRGLENQAQETLKGLKEKETKARSELRFPSFAASCKRRGRLAIRANSTATKIAFTATNRTTAIKIMTK